MFSKLPKDPNHFTTLRVIDEYARVQWSIQTRKFQIEVRDVHFFILDLDITAQFPLINTSYDKNTKTVVSSLVFADDPSVAQDQLGSFIKLMGKLNNNSHNNGFSLARTSQFSDRCKDFYKLLDQSNVKKNTPNDMQSKPNSHFDNGTGGSNLAF